MHQVLSLRLRTSFACSSCSCTTSVGFQSVCHAFLRNKPSGILCILVIFSRLASSTTLFNHPHAYLFCNSYLC
ncbi:unnamed protein product [Amoebophrya sp. A25]|nr:unnamed protein product [Amoebophrya sp. A25]|eukprot:GSA25T00013978001.1